MGPDSRRIDYFENPASLLLNGTSWCGYSRMRRQRYYIITITGGSSVWESFSRSCLIQWKKKVSWWKEKSSRSWTKKETRSYGPILPLQGKSELPWTRQAPRRQGCLGWSEQLPLGMQHWWQVPEDRKGNSCSSGQILRPLLLATWIANSPEMSVGKRHELSQEASILGKDRAHDTRCVLSCLTSQQEGAFKGPG